ncbi:MAG: hypothetical protein PQJ59_02035 [Spirochaetales bacterium]|nr:hypothetical protein [Spirochaetales bacterium]
MKKSLLALLIVLLSATVLFAEVSVGGWGRAIVSPITQDGDADGQDDLEAWAGTSWGGDPRVGFTLSAQSEDGMIGVQADVNVDCTSVGQGDQQKIWAKPNDMFTVVIGRAYEDTLRGNGAFGGFNWIRQYGNAWTGEDFIFARARTDATGSYGSMLILDVEGLHAVASFAGMDLASGDSYDTDLTDDSDGDGDATNDADATVGHTTETMFGNAQYQVGYNIDGVGLVRAQVYSFADESGYYQAAFKLTSVDNLYLDFGVTVPQDSDYTEGGANYDATLNGYMNYGIDGGTIHALAIVSLTDSDYADAEDAEDIGFEVAAGLDYGIGEGLSLCTDVRYNKGATADDGTISGTLGVTKGYSNGKIGVGVQGYNDGDETYFAVPVTLEYWF